MPTPGVDWALKAFPEAYLDVGEPVGSEDKLQPVGDRYLLPNRFWGRLHDTALPTIRMDLEYDGQQISIVEIRIATRRNSNQPAAIDLGVVDRLGAVSRLPFRRIVTVIAAFAARRVYVRGDGTNVVEDLEGGDHAAFRRALAQHERVARTTEGTDALLRAVAQVYLDEERRAPTPGNRRKPVQMVMKRWGCSRATASRWVQQARARGHFLEGDQSR